MSATSVLGEATLRKAETLRHQRLLSTMVKVRKEWTRAKEERENAFKVRRRLEEGVKRQQEEERQRLEEQKTRCNEEQVRLDALELRLKSLEDGFCGFNENWQRAIDDLSEIRDMLSFLQQESQLIRNETQSSFEEQRKRCDEIKEKLELEIQKQQELRCAYHELERSLKKTKEKKDDGYRRLPTNEMKVEDHPSKYWNMRLKGGHTPREIYMMRNNFADSLKRLTIIGIASFMLIFLSIYIFPHTILFQYIAILSFMIMFVTVSVLIIKANYELAKALQKNVNVVVVMSLLLVPGIVVYWWLMREAKFNSPSKITKLAIYQ